MHPGWTLVLAMGGYATGVCSALYWKRPVPIVTFWTHDVSVVNAGDIPLEVTTNSINGVPRYPLEVKILPGRMHTWRPFPNFDDHPNLVTLCYKRGFLPGVTCKTWTKDPGNTE